MQAAGNSMDFHFAVLAGEHPPSTITLPRALFMGHRCIRDGDLLHFVLDGCIHTVSFETNDMGDRHVSPGDWERFVDDSELDDYSGALFHHVGEGLFDVTPLAGIGHNAQNAWFRHHYVGASNRPVPHYAAEGLSFRAMITKNTTRQLGMTRAFANSCKLNGHSYMYLVPRGGPKMQVYLEFHGSGLTRFGRGWKAVYDFLNLREGDACTFWLAGREVSIDPKNNININVCMERGMGPRGR